MSLKVDPSQVKPTDKNPALANSLNAALKRIQLSHAKIPHLEKLWDNNVYCFKPLIVW